MTATLTRPSLSLEDKAKELWTAERAVLAHPSNADLLLVEGATPRNGGETPFYTVNVGERRCTCWAYVNRDEVDDICKHIVYALRWVKSNLRHAESLRNAEYFGK